MGNGIISEAAEAVIRWLFEVADHGQIASGIFAGNDALLRIQERLGFAVTGRHNVHSLAQGADLPHIDTLLKRNKFRPSAT